MSANRSPTKAGKRPSSAPAGLWRRTTSVWCCTGSFAAKGDADRARLLMEALIRGRSKAQVLALEIRKGLI
jgi:hypothetical protein